jgi:ribonuclease HI
VAEEFYLRTNKEVFDAELYTIQRALHSAQCLLDDGQVFTKMTIFSDAQAALRHLRNDDEGPGQLLTGSAFYAEDQLHCHGIDIEYWWIPSHIGISGNEAADAAAKRAASHQCDDSDRCAEHRCQAVKWASLAHINCLATETQS